MSCIQELMFPHQAKDENGLQDIMPCVIIPAFKTAATCPIPCCVACELAHACHRPTGATKQLAVEEKAGILSNQYQVGDLISMDAILVGCSLAMDVKPNTISFMVGLSSMMQHQEPFGLNIKSHLVQVKPSVQRSNSKSG
jgi:hypothetical protein